MKKANPTRKGRSRAKRASVKRTKILGFATTLSAAAAITGLAMQTLLAAKAAGCRAFRPNGRVDCDALVEFAASMPDTGEAIDLHLEKAKDVRAARMLKEQRFQERGKQLWPIAIIRQGWTRNVIAAKTKLQAADGAISAECGMRLGLTAPQVDTLRETVRRHIRAALQELHAGDWGRTECPHCKKAVE